LPSNNILETDRQEGLHILSIDNIDFSVENLYSFLAIEIYPNPSADEFKIDLENVSWTTVTVVDVRGKLIEKIFNNLNTTALTLGENWIPGTYLVKIEDADKLSVTYKLIKDF